MGLREKRGRWEYRFTIDGQRVSKLTDLAATEQNMPAAQREEKKHRDSILKGERPAKRLRIRSFNEAVVEFIEYVKVKYAEHPATARRIVTSMASCKEFFKGFSVTSIRTPEVSRYRVHRLSVHKVQPITLRHDLNNLSLFFQWAAEMEYRADNPITRKTYQGLPSEAERIHVITPAEEFLYFERAAAYPNLADVARLILEQGMRPEEVMRLERANFDGTHVTIAHGKTPAARRRLKLTAQSRMILERRAAATKGRWLFPGKLAGCPLTKLNASHDLVCSPQRVDGIPEPEELHFVLYDFRHTFATRAAQAGMDLATLARILGHNSLRMVMKYVHPTQTHQDAEMDRLDAIRANLGPSLPRQEAENSGHDRQPGASVN